jgi:prophage regulatory protein
MEKMLRLPAVKEATGLSRSSIYAFLAAGNFPPPIKLGVRAVGWLESSVQEWVDARVRSANDHGPSRVNRGAP